MHAHSVCSEYVIKTIPSECDRIIWCAKFSHATSLFLSPSPSLSESLSLSLFLFHIIMSLLCAWSIMPSPVSYAKCFTIDERINPVYSRIESLLLTLRSRMLYMCLKKQTLISQTLAPWLYGCAMLPYRLQAMRQHILCWASTRKMKCYINQYCVHAALSVCFYLVRLLMLPLDFLFFLQVLSNSFWKKEEDFENDDEGVKKKKTTNFDEKWQNERY